MKKTTAYLLLAAVIAMLLTFDGTAFAEDETLFGLMPGISRINTGEQFTVTITGQNLKDMDAYEAQIVFDGDKLGLVKAVSDIRHGYMIDPVVKSGGTMTLAFAKTGKAAVENGNMSLCTITFTGKARGSAYITLKSVKLLDGLLKESNHRVDKTIYVNVASAGQTTPTLTPVPASTPAPVKTQVLTITAQSDEDGVASASVNSGELQPMIDNAQGGTVKIKVQAAEGSKEINVAIPAQQVREAGLKQIRGIEVDVGIAMVSFSPDALKGTIGTDSAIVRLSVSKADVSSLSEEVRREIGDNPVYDFNMSVDNRNVSDFGGNTVRIAVDYRLKPGEDPSSVVIYYIGDSGRLEVVKNGRYNPATGKVEFSVTHFSKYAAVCVEVTFNDIAGVPWAKESIGALAARRVISGIGDNAFKPDADVTRAEYLKMLMQAFDLADETAACTFGDVEKGKWYYGSVAAAQALGIVNGKGDGNFGVNERITREDVAVMAYRAALVIKADLKGATNAVVFADEKEISAYAAEAVTAMQKAGIINGTGAGRFEPKDRATRAQAAVIIYRLFNSNQN